MDNTDEKFESSTDDDVQYISDDEIEELSAQITKNCFSPNSMGVFLYAKKCSTNVVFFKSLGGISMFGIDTKKMLNVMILKILERYSDYQKTPILTSVNYTDPMNMNNDKGGRRFSLDISLAFSLIHMRNGVFYENYSITQNAATSPLIICIRTLSLPL